MQKKKLIQVKERKGGSEGYHYKQNATSFSLVSSPEEGRHQCTSLLTCRELLNLTAFNARTKIRSYAHDSTADAPVDFEKLRLLIVQDPDEEDLVPFKKRLFSGKALLNRYEEKAGWKPSKITTVNHEAYDNAWLLTGPKEWMSQPQLLSIATLFIRIMIAHGPMETDAFEQAEHSLKGLYTDHVVKENRRDNVPFTYYEDIDRYLKYLDSIKLLIFESEKIFAGISLDKAWSKDPSADEFSSASGLLTFLGQDFANHTNGGVKIQNYNKCIEGARKKFIALGGIIPEPLTEAQEKEGIQEDV